MATKRDPRFTMPRPGEYYSDLLFIDSWINGRSQGQQACSLLCAKLMERESKIKARVEYLAKKRGMDAEDLWMQILRGEAELMDVPLDLSETQSSETADD